MYVQGKPKDAESGLTAWFSPPGLFAFLRTKENHAVRNKNMNTLTPNMALRSAMDVYIHALEVTSKLGLSDHELRIEFLKAVHLRYRLRKSGRLYKSLRTEIYNFLDSSLAIFCERVITSGMSDNEVTLFRLWIECTDFFRQA